MTPILGMSACQSERRPICIDMRSGLEASPSQSDKMVNIGPIYSTYTKTWKNACRSLPRSYGRYSEKK